MTGLVAAGFVITFVLATATAQAGPCGDDIAKIDTATKQPGSQPSGRQTAATGAHQQPTPGAVPAADRNAEPQFDEIMARARRLDAANDQPGCSRAVAELKLMFGM